MRAFYMSSLQSFLWNKAASHRATEFGLDTVVVGDLVIPSCQEPSSNGKNFSPASVTSQVAVTTTISCTTKI